mmetsp:Transcript_105553/g.183556  ORF Transcript_105553/g.183556 Transcript_105553/m.183556 type:complete len:512 (-) Transcript_105553:38-1573(-)
MCKTGLLPERLADKLPSKPRHVGAEYKHSGCTQGRALMMLCLLSDPGAGWQVVRPGLCRGTVAAPHSPIFTRKLGTQVKHSSMFNSMFANSMLAPDRALMQRSHLDSESKRPPFDALNLGALKSLLLTVLISLSLASVGVSSAQAENELSALATSKSTSELVDTKCLVNQCKMATTSCAESGDCTKGLLCIAKCLGDAKCEVGCFARYENQDLDNLLQCTIEKEKCIKISIMEPGADGPLDAPLPPKPLVPVTQAEMSGDWYKVMGWNPNYDCFDCQRNSFSKNAVSKVGSSNIGSNGMSMEVEFSMPRERLDQQPQTYRSTVLETLRFDKTPSSRRTAHTEGQMFGVSFWENWYVIGKETGSEPEFRFIYYTGKTQLNRYEGAFVYSRQPELPRDALPSIYRIAREAGIEPTGMCCIDNKCFREAEAAKASSPPPFVSVAVASTLPGEEAPKRTTILESNLAPLRRLEVDVREYLEDPHPPAEMLFRKQRKMSELLQFDGNGYRVPTSQQ